MLKLIRQQLDQIIAQAREAHPRECCGLLGGNDETTALSVYPLNNIAPDPKVSYEAAPEDLFTAQRQMRERGEQLLAIYHSHPRSAEPLPSTTDVRLAYYPAALYLIIGLGAAAPVMRAFHVSEKQQRW